MSWDWRNVVHCAHCRRQIEGSPVGEVVTRRGVRPACSAECMAILLDSPDVCTPGELKEIEAKVPAKGLS